MWNGLLKATRNSIVSVAAIDSTTLARSQPSYHYSKRIDRHKPPGIPVKLSIVADTRRKKIMAVQVHILPRGDVRDVKALLKEVRPKTLVADKGYDSEKIHELCNDLGIQTMIPARRTTRRGYYRKKSLERFEEQVYHRRELVEALFSALKRTLGSSIRCRRARTIRAEVLRKCIAYNLFGILKRLSGQSRSRGLCLRGGLDFYNWPQPS